MVVPEIPGLAADVLGGGTEHRALDCHAAVSAVVVTGRKQPFDGQAEEHDAALLMVQMPPRHLIGGIEIRHGADLEADILQFWPGTAEELDGSPDSQIETVDPAIQRRQRGTHDFAASEATVTAMARATPRSGGGGTASTRHVESLGAEPGGRGAASGPPCRFDVRWP